MTGLRYVGASRALGLQQEVPPSPDESGPSSLDLWEHSSNWKPASSKHLPRTAQGRAEGHVALGSMCQHPAGTSQRG